MSKIELPEEWVCPVCGAQGKGVETYIRTLSLPFMPKIDMELFVCTCGVCKESGDFIDRNDEIITAAIHRANCEFLKESVAFFKKRGYSEVSLDRILNLPVGTVTSWVGTLEFPPEAVALVRVLRAFPWMLLAADGSYSPEVSGSLVVKAASEVLNQVQARLK